MTLEAALKRYLSEVTPTKKPSTQKGEASKAKKLTTELGKYSLAALSSEIIAAYRDKRLSQPATRKRTLTSNNTVWLELALLGHLYSTAIKEWGLGLKFNPVASIRKPKPGKGRERRFVRDEGDRLLGAANAHSNPMLGWMARIAVETTMRSSEIAKLTLSQADLKKRVVVVGL